MRTYKITHGRHYRADATMAVPEPYWKQLLYLISCKRFSELYGEIISTLLFVRLKRAC